MNKNFGKTQDPRHRTVTTDSGCMEWTGALFSTGYGHTRFNGKDISAHRKAWILTHGEIPGGLLVLHRCDNPKCCNTDHLFLGTHKENAIDREAKGRGGWAGKQYPQFCKHGHEYTPENSLYQKSPSGRPGRKCRICQRATVRAYRQRRRLSW